MAAVLNIIIFLKNLQLKYATKISDHVKRRSGTRINDYVQERRLYKTNC